MNLYLTPAYNRRAGTPPCIGGIGAHKLIRSTYDPDLHRLFPNIDAYCRSASSVLISVNRVEIILYDKDIGEPIGAVVYSKQHDIHYGEVACPVTVMLVPEYKGIPAVSRQVVKAIKRAAYYLGCKHYYVVKHLGGDTQLHRLKEMK